MKGLPALHRWDYTDLQAKTDEWSEAERQEDRAHGKAESWVSTRRCITWRSLLCEMESVLKEGKEAGRVKQGGVLKGPDGKAFQPLSSSHDFCLGSRVVNDHFHAHTGRRIRTLLQSSLMNQFFFKDIKAESWIRNCGNHLFKIFPYSEYRKCKRTFNSKIRNT